MTHNYIGEAGWEIRGQDGVDIKLMKIFQFCC